MNVSLSLESGVNFAFFKESGNLLSIRKVLNIPKKRLINMLQLINLSLSLTLLTTPLLPHCWMFSDVEN